ncbi:MAG: hypothetical protein J3Q66DRAFT_168687 [Benniella sp.]|nr:MAG: hypothetical protein J3Q66DRAFT_168687 [Benniella sp.]
MSSVPPLESLPVYNILLLGTTQSGKSTFLEGVKQYADPSYKVNHDRIGKGNKTCTLDVHTEMITTNLPVYRLYDLKADANEELDIFSMFLEKSVKACKILLECDEGLKLCAEEMPDSKWARFRIIDTPGLDDTKGNDIPNIAKTFSALSDIDEIHLVLIINSLETPVLPSQEAAYKSYFQVFEELKSLLTIVHTKVPNIHRHPKDTKIGEKFSERTAIFNEIAGFEVPAKTIDCDLDEEAGLTHVCLTRNTIREILEMATVKTPVFSLRTNVCKPPAMIAVDDVLRKKYKEEMDSVIKSSSALDEASQLDIQIQKIEEDISAENALIQELDTDDLIQLFDERFEEGWKFTGWEWVEEHTMEFPLQEFTITRMRVAQQSINILDEDGGEDKKYWNIRFSRKWVQSGYYHVVLSTTSRNKHKRRIDQCKTGIDYMNETLVPLRELYAVAKHKTGESTDGTDPKEMLMQFQRRSNRCRKMLNHLTSKTLPMELFFQLANSGIYKGSDTSMKALENHLLEMFGEKLEEP